MAPGQTSRNPRTPPDSAEQPARPAPSGAGLAEAFGGGGGNGGRERENEAFAAVKLHRQKTHNTKHNAHKKINSTLHLSNLKNTQHKWNGEGAKGMKLS